MITGRREGHPSIVLLHELSNRDLVAMAETTGGDGRIFNGKTLVLWQRGGVVKTTQGDQTEFAGRGILARFGSFLEDAAVIRRPFKAMVVFPTAPGEPIQAYRVRKGRMALVERLPFYASDALKTAANLAWETAQRSPNRSGR